MNQDLEKIYEDKFEIRTYKNSEDLSDDTMFGYDNYCIDFLKEVLLPVDGQFAWMDKLCERETKEIEKLEEKLVELDKKNNQLQRLYDFIMILAWLWYRLGIIDVPHLSSKGVFYRNEHELSIHFLKNVHTEFPLESLLCGVPFLSWFLYRNWLNHRKNNRLASPTFRAYQNTQFFVLRKILNLLGYNNEIITVMEELIKRMKNLR